MGLSRLDNFLKSTRGEILYVDPSSIDSTDSIENKGNSLTRPFKTIQRALIEAARFSYQKGLDNDRFGKTTILLYPGEHLIDNRPGWIPDSSLGVNQYRLRDGTSSDDFGPFDVNTNFNIASENNALYKMNSIHGGVIIPRGTSIVGYDLRKTKIRPKYVPNPDEVDGRNIERSAIFRVTGACYLWQFSLFDADPNIPAYIDYSTNTFFPRLSHHKLTCFEYADGINPVTINDEFISNFSTSRTDLDMYYEKVGIAYGASSDRGIEPDYPSSLIDIQAKLDEYLIVGSRGDEVGITSIRAGNGTVTSNVITVELSKPFKNLDVDSPVQIKGIGPAGYNGQQVVSKIISDTEIQYKVQVPPDVPNVPFPAGATLSLILDTVNSASPYIFNCSLRSVYGMCGLHADGDKAGGFKSMVVAQFTGIGLQKDNKAFVKYNENTGEYQDVIASGDQNIYANSNARYKPSYESYHIKCSNNAFIQVVSVFAIGFTRHFFTESGGDQSITNSNSNFGANSLTASGFRNESFLRDDVGYITHIIPPKEIEPIETNLEFYAIDAQKTKLTPDRIYLYNRTLLDSPPNYILDGYRIGAKTNDKLYLGLNNQIYSATITIPGTALTKQKVKYVSKNGTLNNITDNVISFDTNHPFKTGEKVRIISEDGYLPDGIEEDQVYYVICLISGNSASNINNPNRQIKLAKTFNDALNDNPVTINNRGGLLKVVSKVSDKKPGEEGHPIQWDGTQWYVSVASSGTDNTIFNAVSSLALNIEATPRTYIKRIVDTRSLSDTLYKLRYVIPSTSSINSRPPIEGFILQESNTTTGRNDEEVTKYFRPKTDPAILQSIDELRNFKFISSAIWTNKVTTITTELSHNLSVGSEVEIKNIKSTSNINGVDKIGFNGTFIVTEVPSRRTFRYALSTNPGRFTSNTSIRTTDLPKFSRKKYTGNYSIYRCEEIKKYVQGEQDGVYHLIINNSSNSPAAFPFDTFKLSQPIEKLYPRTNRDEPISDPLPTKSFAIADPIGKVVVNDPEYSVTRETIDKSLIDFNFGKKISNIITNPGTSSTSHTILTKNDHGLNRVISVNISSGGSNYGIGSGVTETYYNAQLISNTGVGTEASAKVTVGLGGTISSIEIMDGGSSFVLNEQLSVVGIATTNGYVPATVVVNNVYSNVDDNIKVANIIDQKFTQYNGLYKISSVNGPRSFSVYSPDQIPNSTLTGIGETALSSSYFNLTGKSIAIVSFSYDQTVGIATFATQRSHGLFKNNKISISGANDSFFNGSFVVNKVLSPTIFDINIGIKNGSYTTTGIPYLNYEGVSSRGGATSKENENVFERMIFNYGDVTTYLVSDPGPSISNDQIFVLNKYDLKIGDFLLVNREIMRIKSTVDNSNPNAPIEVQRGVLGTIVQNHPATASPPLVRRINVVPVEFRRNSILRAAGHTFEYLGYGPGNYSTAFPERQDRQLTAQEELFSQSAKFAAGSVIFTGMNSNGDFYIGNKKINSSGKGETYDTPIPTFTGDLNESSSNLGIDYINPDVVSVTRSINVEGGIEGNTISRFNGPVIFNEKITSNSTNGIEANSLLLQGNATISRKYTVGISTPTVAGNPGDVIYDAYPKTGGSIGWVYTEGNQWARFGSINISESSAVGVFDTLTVNTPNVSIGVGTQQFSINSLGNVGIGTSADPSLSFGKLSLRLNGTFYGDGSGLTNVSDIWVRDQGQSGIHTNTPIGINTTSSKPPYGLYVEGTMAINGSLRVFEIIEKATVNNTTILGSGSGVVTLSLADNNVYYFTQPAIGNWTISLVGDRVNKLPTDPGYNLGGVGLGNTNTGFLDVGETMTVAILTTQGATPYYNGPTPTNPQPILIDGQGITPNYYGGEIIISGNANSIDVYTYVIIRKALTGSIAQQFTVLYSQAQYK